MAQLIKLLDYISRYESNPFHYPSQYIRLKQENWQALEKDWEAEQTKGKTQAAPVEEEAVSRFKWNPFVKKAEQTKDPVIEEEDLFLPRSKKQLIQYFLNQLYPFQIKWATTTLSQVSFIDPKYNHEANLRYLLQRMPDIYLVMYHPIFNIKQAPIESEIIIISPLGVDIICLMEEHPDTNIIVTDERMWDLEMNNSKTKIISPLIALKRTEQIVKGIFNRHEIDFPINKIVLSKTNRIICTSEPYQTAIIGKREFDAWLEHKRQLSSPLKNVQLRAMEALLLHCQTTSVTRPEWEDTDTPYETITSFEEK